MKYCIFTRHGTFFIYESSLLSNNTKTDRQNAERYPHLNHQGVYLCLLWILQQFLSCVTCLAYVIQWQRCDPLQSQSSGSTCLAIYSDKRHFSQFNTKLFYLSTRFYNFGKKYVSLFVLGMFFLSCYLISFIFFSIFNK
jgi:hypothetical protein